MQERFKNEWKNLPSFVSVPDYKFEIKDDRGKQIESRIAAVE
jgi:hypothetical protein